MAELALVKRMKPVEFSLEQMRELLETVRALRDLEHGDDADPARAERWRERSAMYQSVVDARVESLREQLHRAEGFAAMLRTPTRLHDA